VPRRKWFRAALFAALTTGFIGCKSRPEGAGDARALADTLTSMIEDAYDFSRPDVVERMTRLYADTGRVVSASDGRMIASADSIRQGIATFWQVDGRNMRNPIWTWGDVHVDRLGPDAAVLTATWSIPHTTPGDQPHVLGGAWTAVFRRIDGRWKIVHEHLSEPPTEQ
jgi:ketosteroid isomerase-like protein